MEKVWIEGKIFKQIKFAEHLILIGKYEKCSFISCHFNQADLSGYHFTECNFIGCDLSLTKTSQTVFNEVHFTECKILGVHFDYCKPYPFAVAFDRCILNLSSFYQRKLKKTCFNKCSLHEVDFTEADLSEVDFNECDLIGATFDNTNLAGVDFRTAFNYQFDPEKNKLKKTKFSTHGAIGLLSKYDIEIE